MLSSAVFLDHKAKKVTIALMHGDVDEGGKGELLLELPFETNVLETIDEELASSPF